MPLTSMTYFLNMLSFLEQENKLNWESRPT